MRSNLTPCPSLASSAFGTFSKWRREAEESLSERGGTAAFFMKGLLNTLLVLLLFLSAETKAQQITVSDSVVHTLSGDSSGSITLHATGVSYRWNTGDTTNQIANLPEGLYTVTVSDGTDSVVKHYGIYNYTTWSLLRNVNETGTRELVCTGGFDEENIFENLAFGAETFLPDSISTVVFNFDTGQNSLVYICGLVTDTLFDDSTSGYIILAVLTDSVPDLEKGIYVPSHSEGGEDFIYLGSIDDTVPLSISLIRNGTAVTLLKNGIECLVDTFPVPQGVHATVAPLLENSRVKSVVWRSFTLSPMEVSAEATPAESVNATGSITTTVTGGMPPYSFSPLTSPLTHPLTPEGGINPQPTGNGVVQYANVPVGEYQLTVTDANDNSATKNVFVGGYADWSFMVNKIETPEHEIRVGSPYFYDTIFGMGLAFGRNELPQNENGIVSFDFAADSAFYGVAGLFTNVIKDALTGGVTEFIDAAIFLIIPDTNDIAKNEIYFARIDTSSAEIIYMGSWQKGEPLNLKIYMRSDSVTAVKNDVQSVHLAHSRTTAVSPLILSIDYSVVKAVTVDFGFENRVSVNADITHNACGDHAGGSIALTDIIGTPPFTYLWKSPPTPEGGIIGTDSAITDLGAGAYSVMIIDSAGDTIQQNFHVGYTMQWDTLDNITIDSNGALYTDSIIGIAVAANTLYTGTTEKGWFDYKIAAGNNFHGVIGFITPDSDTSHHGGGLYGLRVTHATYLFVAGSHLVIMSYDSLLNGRSLGSLNFEQDNTIHFERTANDSLLISLNDKILVHEQYTYPVLIKPMAAFVNLYTAFTGDDFNANKLEYAAASFCNDSALFCRDSLDPVAITILEGADTVCAGTQIIFTATSYYGATMEWFANAPADSGGVLVGTGDTLVIAPDSSTTFYVRNRSYCPSVDGVMVSQYKEKRVEAWERPFVAPLESQVVYSDTSFTFIFKNFVTSLGSDSVEWSYSSDYSSSAIIGVHDSISVSVDTMSTETIWVRGINTLGGGCIGESVIGTATVNSFSTTEQDSTALNGDKIYFDRFGNWYSREELELPEGAQAGGGGGNICTQAGFFHITWSGANSGFDETDVPPGQTLTLGEIRRNVICQVLSDLSALIEQSVNPCTDESDLVEITVTGPDLGNASVLGTATSYTRDIKRQGIMDNAVWTTINSGVNTDPGVSHASIQINFNPGVNWYYDLNSPNIGNFQFDMYSVALHEMLHALGFASYIWANGVSRQTFSSPGIYSRYDTHLFFNQLPMIDWDCLNAEFNTAIANPFTATTGLCQNVRFLGGNAGDQPVHAPSPFRGGSSLSHFEIGCNGTITPNYIMTPSVSFPFINRAITLEEVRVLCDLGYHTTGIFGDQSLYFHVDDLPSCGSVVASVPDGLLDICPNETYEIDACVGSYVDIDVLENDINATSISCVEVISGGGTATIQGGTVLHYEPTTIGIKWIVYRAEDDNGNWGNMTLVRVNVICCGNPSIPGSNPCNIICNGDFQNNTITPPTIFTPPPLNQETDAFNGGLVTCWTRTHGTPSCNVTTVAPTVPSNSGIAYMWARYNYGEGITTCASIQQSHQYLLSYQRRRATPIAHIYFMLTQSIVSSPNTGSSGSPIPPSPTHSQVIYNDQFNLGNTDWEQIITCFEADNDYGYLWIYPQQNVNNLTQGDIFLDNIELIEDDFVESSIGIDGSAGPDKYINCPGSTVIGTELCQMNNISYEWRVVGNATVIGTTPTLTVTPSATTDYELTRTFVDAGNFDVQMHPANGCSIEKTDRVTVHVLDEVCSDFTYVINCGSNEVSVANSCNWGTHTWDFGDGTPIVNTGGNGNTTHTYSNSGTYTVIHTHATACGTDNENHTIPVSISLQVNVDDITSGCLNIAGQNKLFADVTGGTPAYQYAWSPAGYVSDPAIADPFAEHIGDYTLTVTVTDNNGCTASDEVNVSLFEECCETIEEGCIEIIGNYNTAQFVAAANGSGSTVSNKCIVFTGTLTVDNLLVLNNMHLQMGAGSKIVVKGNNIFNLFIIQGTRLYAACNKMWKGIELETGASLWSMALGNQRSSIEDALYAVHVTGVSNVSAGSTDFKNNFVGIYVPPAANGSEVGVLNCNFLSTGNMKPYYAGEASASSQPSLPPQSGTYRSWAGIDVNNAFSVRVNASLFEHLACGIRSENSRVDVTASQFKDILAFPYNGGNGYPNVIGNPAKPCSGIGISHSSRGGNYLLKVESGAGFNNVTDCIKTYASDITVQNCDIYNGCRTGITCEGPKNAKVNITGNDITCTNSGIALYALPGLSKLNISNNEILIDENTSNGALRQAIALEGCSYFPPNNNFLNYVISSLVEASVSDNDITAHRYATDGIRFLKCTGITAFYNEVNCTDPSTNAYGIRVEGGNNVFILRNTITGGNAVSPSMYGRYPNSPAGIYGSISAPALFACNEISTIRNGIVFNGVNSIEKNLYGNGMEYNDKGLYLIPQGVAVIGTQFHTLNKWYGGYSTYSGQNLGQSNLSNFWVNSNYNNSLYYPSGLNPQNGWFIPDNTDGNHQDICGILDNIKLKSLFFRGIGDLDRSIANGDSLGNVYIKQSNYEAQRQLYYKLRTNDTLLKDDTLMFSFYNAAQPTTVGMLDSVQHALENIFKLDTATRAALDNADSLISEWVASIAAIDSILLSDTTGALPDTVLLQQVDSLIGLIGAQHAFKDSIYSIINTAQYAAADSLALFNSNITTNHVWEEYEKTVNSIYLQTVAKDSFALGEGSTAAIGYIAADCPIAYGRGVYMARALYHLENDTIDWSDSCVEHYSAKRDVNEETTTKQSVITKPEFLLYPNPTTNSFTFEYANVHATVLRVRLFDMLGNLLEQAILNSEDGKRSFSCDKYNSGVIVIRVEGDGEYLYGNRVILLR